jgi:hypothetical protein
MLNLMDRNLLLRIARRLEEQAEADHKRVPIGADAKVHENARRKRDRELGDAKDLREYVKRMDTAAAEVPEPTAP